ncbi:hypothetical protein F5Y19DRAFT_463416 [Xylariaceae sp. FL1651]|nr:hypothetical protein F5Y19DRAFT_463416 [Xylariaceae sp. FL1651]
MSVYRLALKAIIETCISQGAWIWVSGFRKGKTEAKLEDFKMFDEASRGLYGALAAVYNGIIAAVVSDTPVSCETANCTWPIFPSLAVCGSCVDSLFDTSCDSDNGCSYSMPSGTSIYTPPDALFEYHFTVAPSNGSSTFPDTNSKAIISIFDMIYAVTVTNGIVNRSVTAEWAKSYFAPENSAHYDEYVFMNIPSEMNARDYTRYSVPLDSLETLKAFMDKLMLGNVSQMAGTVNYDTDWIQAMEDATKDLSGWISRLTLSLTKDIQLTGTVRPNGNFEYSGATYIMAPHVKVNWYWVIYPISLMIFAFLYLMQTSDSLPMLFCQVSKAIHMQVRDAMDVPEGLNDRIGRTEVELIRKDNGEWIFIKPRTH